MSFRYTNYVTGLWKQRILLNRATQAIATRTYTGRSTAGVEVQCNAYNKLLAISVDDAARAAFVDPASGNVRAAPLSRAIRAALFDANLKIRRDKEEAYRESLRGAPELSENDHERSSLWNHYANNGAALAPRCYEALRDEPYVEAMLQQQQQQQKPEEEGKAVEKKTSSVSIFGELRAAKKDSMAACMPDHAGALIQLEEDPVLLGEKQRMRLDDGETAFWQRVDLIRRAQTNVIGKNKRNYEEFEAPGGKTSAGDYEEKLKLSFTR